MDYNVHNNNIKHQFSFLSTFTHDFVWVYFIKQYSWCFNWKFKDFMRFIYFSSA